MAYGSIVICRAEYAPKHQLKQTHFSKIQNGLNDLNEKKNCAMMKFGETLYSTEHMLQ